MRKFQVRQSGGWYEAECAELGIGITSRRLEGVEEIARQAVSRMMGPDEPVVIVMIPPPARRGAAIGRLAAFFLRSNREGRS